MNTTQWIPDQELYTPFVVPESPFSALQTLPRQQWLTLRALPAEERRLYVPNFLEIFDWEALRPHLPLQLASLPDVSPWKGRRCRSYYRWLPPEETLTADAWQGLDDFDVIFRLFDFTAWRPIFAQRFRSHLGPPPFDPLSIGLGLLLARWRGWSPGKLAQELRSPERGRGYCQRLGIDPHDVPSESTFRAAHTAMSEEQFRECEQRQYR